VNRLIVIRKVPEQINGSWMEMQREVPVVFIQYGFARIEMVPTGDVEWDGFDNCAEVYVPANKLMEWQREHALEADAR
jgi:hypothetical protein